MHPLAGKPAPKSILPDIPALVSAYYTVKPDPADLRCQVSFGTSGHRGTSRTGSFNEAHILAIVQAVCLYRRQAGTTGPLYIGKDTHALSEPAQITALEVLAANGVETMVAGGAAFTPTPSISHAILAWNRGRTQDLADGLVITPSHNPPDNGGIKYNPPNGGPADTDVTGWIAAKANELLKNGNRDVKRLAYAAALKADCVHEHDFITPYVEDLKNVIDMDAIRAAGLRLGADALGGSGLGYWEPIAARYGLKITLLNGHYDPTFGFEVAVILQHGMKRMLEDQVDEYFYLTLMNEAYTHPDMPKGAEEGRKLYFEGNEQTGVPACEGCHGTKAEGNSKFPRLAGQHSEYLVKQIYDFRTNVRNTTRIMREVSVRMTDAEIKAVVEYVNTL